MLINLSSCCIFAVYLVNILCWTVGKYLLVNINEEQENQDTESGNSDNEFHEWTGLQDNDVISHNDLCFPVGTELCSACMIVG